jgi:hypothetical protein
MKSSVTGWEPPHLLSPSSSAEARSPVSFGCFVRSRSIASPTAAEAPAHAFGEVTRDGRLGLAQTENGAEVFVIDAKFAMKGATYRPPTPFL